MADNWPDMDKHLGFHLETLALLGLPLATGLENDEEEMGSLQLEGGGNNSKLELLQDDAAEYESEGPVFGEDRPHTLFYDLVEMHEREFQNYSIQHNIYRVPVDEVCRPILTFLNFQ
jgi:hypothetical protein